MLTAERLTLKVAIKHIDNEYKAFVVSGHEGLKANKKIIVSTSVFGKTRQEALHNLMCLLKSQNINGSVRVMTDKQLHEYEKQQKEIS